MKGSKLKVIGGIILLAVIVGIQFFMIFRGTDALWQKRNERNRKRQIRSISATIENLFRHMEDFHEQEVEDRVTRTGIAGILVGRQLAADREKEPGAYGDGYVVRVLGDTVEAPNTLQSDLHLSPDSFQDQKGYFVALNERKKQVDIVYYYRLEDSCWYIEMEPYTDLIDYTFDKYDIQNTLLKSIEAAYDCFLIQVFDQDADEEESGIISDPFIYYESEKLKDESGSSLIEITREMIEKAKTETADGTSDGKNPLVVLNGMEYEVFAFPVNIADETLLLLMPYHDHQSIRMTTGITFLSVFVFASLGIIFTVWIISVRAIVREHCLTDSQKKYFSPERIRVIEFAFICIGLVIVTVASILVQCLYSMYRRGKSAETTLTAVMADLDSLVADDEKQIQRGQEKYKQYALKTAEMLQNYPEMLTEQVLGQISELTDTEYIVVYDSGGKEYLTDSSYRGLTISSVPGSSTYALRNLLKGAEFAVSETAVDEMSGRNTVLVGTRIELPSAPDGSGDADEEIYYSRNGYGALVFAVSPEQILSGKLHTESDVLGMMVTDDEILFEVNIESGILAACSDGSLEGASASSLGIKESFLRDNNMGYFSLNGTSYYGASLEKDEKIYVFAEKSKNIFTYFPKIIFEEIAAFLIMMIVLYLYWTAGYRKFFEDYCNVGTSLSEDPDHVGAGGARQRHSVDPSRRWIFVSHEKNEMTPYHVARGTMRILFLIFMAVLVFAMFYERRSSEFSITVYVLGGHWEKGLNLFSVVSILLFIFCVYVSVILLDSLLYLISKSTGTKGETICRLLINLVDYVSVLICIYFFFRSLGFDTRALLASLGLLSFAISLGAKDLISNILSGITIVFEGEYQVGDIIEVDGYRGTVLEIGVRTTKIEGKGGNIKIIGNQDMKNVINMTRKNSWYAVEINVPADIKLSELEKVFEEQFPLIGAEIPEILSGPYFSGVTGLGKGLGRALITLTILAECNEADYFKVQRKLNRKIQALLEEHGITVM